MPTKNIIGRHPSRFPLAINDAFSVSVALIERALYNLGFWKNNKGTGFHHAIASVRSLCIQFPHFS